jgi:hypothetical protein
MEDNFLIFCSVCGEATSFDEAILTSVGFLVCCDSCKEIAEDPD